MASDTPSNGNYTARQRKTPKHFLDNANTYVTKRLKTQAATSTASTPTATQSSTSSTRSTRVRTPSSPPCAQPHTPEDADSSDDGTGSQSPDQEPIELSDSDDDVIEVVEDDDEELGECGV